MFVWGTIRYFPLSCVRGWVANPKVSVGPVIIAITVCAAVQNIIIINIKCRNNIFGVTTELLGRPTTQT